LSETQNDGHGGGCVNVGAIQVKKLQALCYWVRDQQKHGQGITQDDWV
jgi:hypothetical protein